MGGDRLEGSNSRDRIKRFICFALSAGLYWSWWDSLHEMFRFKSLGATDLDPTTFIEGGVVYLQCLGKPLGMALGCILVLFGWRIALKSRGDKRSLPFSKNGLLAPWFAIALLLAQIVVYVAFCVFLSSELRASAAICYFLTSTLVVFSFLGLWIQFKAMESHEVGWAIVCALICYGTFSNLAFPFLFRDALPAIGYLVYLGLLLAAFALGRAASGQIDPDPTEDDSVTRPPLRPAFHLVIYGSVFGMLHILEGVVESGPYSVNVDVFWGCIIAVLLFYVLFIRGERNSREIWSKMRSTVFPLVIVGYLLIPLAAGSDLALSFTEAGGLLYLAILLFVSASLMWRTYVAPTIIMSWMFLLYSIGEAFGVAAMVAVDPAQLVAGTGYYGFSVVIVVLLTAATFWVGSDEQIRKIWGLRRDMSPKRFNDAMVTAQVELLAERHGLTPREADVLRFVANGRRAPEISDEMGVSHDTVRTHLKHLYTKLDVHSYVEAARMVKETEVSDTALLKHSESA